MKIKWVLFPLTFVVIYFMFNTWQVYDFAKDYSEQKSDVAIILGAGTHDGKVSPVFRERLNHGDYLLRKGFVKTIIVTGGFGKGEVIKIEGKGTDLKAEIKFESVGVKKLLLRFAKLEIL